MRPERKVVAASLGAAVSVLLIGVLRRVGVDLTEVEAGALTTVVVFSLGYWVPNPKPVAT